ncbi:hypothetical protein J6590_107822, partial [Homalodisca vitripennis]
SKSSPDFPGKNGNKAKAMVFEVKTSLGALSVSVEGKILGSRHRHANDTNLHEK